MPDVFTLSFRCRRQLFDIFFRCSTAAFFASAFQRFELFLPDGYFFHLR